MSAADHELVIEEPGRHGARSVTGACVCRMWSASVIIGNVGARTPEEARDRLRALYARDHEPHLPDLRRDAAASRLRETELEALRRSPIKRARDTEASLHG